jgi:predicted nucleic acid-binding protein
VADSNIYISAILFGGRSEEIRRLAIEGRIQLFVSELILAEIAGVLPTLAAVAPYQEICRLTFFPFVLT